MYFTSYLPLGTVSMPRMLRLSYPFPVRSPYWFPGETGSSSQSRDAAVPETLRTRREEMFDEKEFYVIVLPNMANLAPRCKE